MLKGARPRGKLLLIDGEGLHSSTGLAELLAQAGADISYVTAGFSPLSPRLVDSFESRWIVQRLKQSNRKEQEQHLFRYRRPYLR